MSEWYSATKHGKQLIIEVSCPLMICVVAISVYGMCGCATYIDRKGKYYIILQSKKSWKFIKFVKPFLTFFWEIWNT